MRPLEAADVALALGERLGFAASHREQIDLLVGIAVGEEGQGFSVGRPFGEAFGFFRISDLAERAGGGLEEPDVTRALIAFRRFGDDESDAGAVW